MRSLLLWLLIGVVTAASLNRPSLSFARGGSTVKEDELTIVKKKKKKKKRRRISGNTTALRHRMALLTEKLSKIAATESRNRSLAISQEDTLITSASNLTAPGRHFHIVTTAALPWFTGTAVNPLLRAANMYDYLTELHNNTAANITLVLPWLELPEDQETLYGQIFESPEDQDAFIRNWLSSSANLKAASDGLKIAWYPARYHASLGSIFAMGDMLINLDQHNKDVCILEEPEHCNWYRAPGAGWASEFTHVIGIVHTNYREYAIQAHNALGMVITAPALQLMSTAMVRAYCHKVISLSEALPAISGIPHATTNVHGVRRDFLQAPAPTEGIYFIGKLLWTKGLDHLLELQDYYKECTGNYFEMEIYGNGPDADEIQRAYHGRRVQLASENNTKFVWPKRLHEYRRQPLPVQFPGRVDHALLTKHKVFVNPSTSEVLCTTTAEALAMGKFVILPKHPSNTWFYQFPNCLIYSNKLEFAANLQWAMTHEPQELSEELRNQFTWPAATERLIEASQITVGQARRLKPSERIAHWHAKMGQGQLGDLLRLVLGGGPVSKQVKYQREHGQIQDDERQTLAEAIQATVNDLSSFMQ